MSLETSLAEVATEMRNSRAWISELAGHQRNDHDTLIRVESAVARLIQTIDEAREEAAEAKKEWAAEARQIRSEIGAAEGKREAEERDRAKEGSSRNWQLWLLILGPVITAAISAAVALLVSGAAK